MEGLKPEQSMSKNTILSKIITVEKHRHKQ